MKLILVAMEHIKILGETRPPPSLSLESGRVRGTRKIGSQAMEIKVKTSGGTNRICLKRQYYVYITGVILSLGYLIVFN